MILAPSLFPKGAQLQSWQGFDKISLVRKDTVELWQGAIQWLI